MTVNARSILFRQPLGWAFRRCSQIARTVQPSRLRRRRFFRSRDMLAAIFRSHASDRFSRHSSNRYPCQKSPSTKMTTRSFRNTKSGRPGRSLACLSGSRPLSSSSFLRVSSGFVFLPRIRDMTALRVAGLMMSPRCLRTPETSPASGLRCFILPSESCTCRWNIGLFCEPIRSEWQGTRRREFRTR